MPSIDTLGKIAIALSVPDWQLFASKEEAVNDTKKELLTCPYCGKPIDVSLLKAESDE